MSTMAKVASKFFEESVPGCWGGIRGCSKRILALMTDQSATVSLPQTEHEGLFRLPGASPEPCQSEEIDPAWPTVKNFNVGSSVQFVRPGERSLKGVPSTGRIYTVGD
jgi:hypothetical protein